MRVMSALSMLASLWAMPMGKSTLATASCVLAFVGSCWVLLFSGRRA